MRLSLVIFRLVWDFGGRLFDLFLEPLFGAKKSPFFVTTVICAESLACDGGFIDLNGPLHSAARSKHRML